MKFVGLFILSMLLFSCADYKKGAQLKEISSMLTVLENIHEQWDTTQLHELDGFIFTGDSLVKEIASHYNNQRVSTQTASELDQFKLALEGFRQAKELQFILPKAVVDKIKALKELKSDIMKGSGKRDQFDNYISFEKSEIQTISMQYENCLSLISNSKQQFETALPAVVQFVETLNTKL